MPEDDSDEVTGRFDAIEDDRGQMFVWDAGRQEIVRYCKTRREAEKAAKALATMGN